MRILQVTIQNLNSLRVRKTLHFDRPPLSRTGLFAITGDTGAGKTTILDALTLALYGQVPRNKDVQAVMSWDTGESMAEVVFDHAGHRYRVRWLLWRSRGQPDGRIQPPKRELARFDPQTNDWAILAEKIREVDEAVENITGLDYDRFRRSVLLAQGDFAAFLDADARDRSELLERITGTAIYSELSQAAFRRFRDEEQKLLLLTEQQKGLTLLSEEERKSLEEREVFLRKQSQDLGNQLEEIRRQLQAYERLEALAQKIAWRQKALQDVTAAESAHAADQARLEQSQRAHPLRELASQLRDKQARLSDQRQALEKVQVEREAIQQRFDELSQLYQQQQQAWAEWQETVRNGEPRWAEASRLDVALEERRRVIAQQEKAVQEARDRCQALEKQRTRLGKEILVAKKKLDEANNWLDQNRGLEKIAQHLERLQFHGQRWLEHEEKSKALRARIRENAQQKDQALQALAEVDKALAEWEAQHERLKMDFTERLSPEYPTDRSDLPRLLQEDLQRLQTLQARLEQLHRVDTDYRRLLQQFNEQAEALEQVQNAVTHFDGTVLNLLERLDEALRKRDFADRIYRQQQQLVNYSQTRAELQPGEPCPVCLSTEHPFREKPIKPYVDEAKAELDRLDQRYQQLRQEWNQEMRRQSDQQAALVQMQQQQTQTHDRVVELEEARAEQYQGLIDSGLLVAHPHRQMDQLRQKVREDIERKVRLQEAVLTFNQALDQLETDRQSAREKWQIHHLEAERATDRLSQNQDKLDALQAEQNEHQVVIQSIRQELNAPEIPIPQLIDQLNQQQQQAQKYQQQRTATQQHLAVLREKANTSQRALEEWTAERDQRVAQWSDLQVERKTLTEQRESLLPMDQDPARVREDMQQQLTRSREACEATGQEKNKVQLELERLESKRGEWQRQLSDLEKAIEAETKEGDQRAVSLGFKDLEDAIQALLPPGSENEIARRARELANQRLEHERFLSELDKEQQQLVQSLKNAEDRSRSQQRYDQLQQTYDALQQEVGSLTEQRKQDDARRQEAGQLAAEKDRQEAELRRWAALQELIGSADGKKFRTFAQSLTLERLTLLANQHLRQLNGRYCIRKSTAAELELNIVDTYQADNERSMRTLSGGERFLVSLALALGLSDLAGRHARIDSLFIDEGFGTLDDNTLDLALTTLENLQASGKTIGVISHVKALKERIGVRIQVNKFSNGFSDWELVE